MKILGTLSEVLSLPDDLSQFISTACPWIQDNWNPEQIGWIFVLDDDDMAAARSLNITPQRQRYMTKIWKVVEIYRER